MGTSPPTGKSGPWPRAAASAVVLRGATVLLVERGKGARQGQWSLPGGHIEAGETAAAAAIREVAEETGLAIAIVDLVGVSDVILRADDGTLVAHYLLATYAAHAADGEPVAATDAAAARFVPLDELAHYRLTPGVLSVIDRARSILKS